MQGEFRGDFSRDSYDRAKRFSRVLMQQGRVQLDADWNEQSDILLHYLRSLAADLIGPHGGSGTQPGFALFTKDTEVDALTDANGAPLDADTIDRLKSSLRDDGFLIGTGRYYVDGLLCESNEYLGFTEQAGFPFAGTMSFEDIRDKTGSFLVLLDVWERHVSCTEDGDICEVALGGPDTATRAQVVASVVVPPPQVGNDKLYDQQQLVDAAKKLADAVGDAAIAAARKTLNDFAEAVRLKLNRVSTARLRARARVSGMPEGDCNIKPEAQYRGLENQLYRVEIQRGGIGWDGKADKEKPAGNAKTAATFKWSRDNASINIPIISLQGDTVVLAHLGRDTSRGLQVDDWVEIVGDDLALQGQPGPLRRVKSVNPDELIITLSEGVDQSYEQGGTLHPVLRRWDQQRSDGASADNLLLVREGTGDDLNWIELEDGVQIQFAPSGDTKNPSSYRAGDYWLIPARVATGDVIWPKEKDSTGKKVGQAVPPHGTDHHYAPIAVISSDGSQKIVLQDDLRRKFAPLAV